MVKIQDLVVTVWDFAGNDRGRVLWKSYFEHVCAVIFVVDATDRGRIRVAQKELHHLKRISRLEDRVVMILVNKIDVADAMTIDEVRQLLRFDALSFTYRKQIFGISMKTGEGLEEALTWFVHALHSWENPYPWWRWLCGGR